MICDEVVAQSLAGFKVADIDADYACSRGRVRVFEHSHKVKPAMESVAALRARRLKVANFPKDPYA